MRRDHTRHDHGGTDDQPPAVQRPHQRDERDGERGESCQLRGRPPQAGKSNKKVGVTCWRVNVSRRLQTWRRRSTHTHETRSRCRTIDARQPPTRASHSQGARVSPRTLRDGLRRIDRRLQRVYATSAMSPGHLAKSPGGQWGSGTRHTALSGTPGGGALPL